MNESLKWTWGHTIALVCQLPMAYLIFMGVTFLSDGSFLLASSISIVYLILICFLALFAKSIKERDRDFEKNRQRELVVIASYSLLFLTMLCSLVSHAFSVIERGDELKSSFTQALEHGKGIFVDYEMYANKRISSYESVLNKAIENKNGSTAYTAFGFTPGLKQAQKNNALDVLRLQLYSQNYNNLHDVAIDWLDQPSGFVSPWNIFLMGSIPSIAETFSYWNETLNEYSNVLVVNENLGGEEIVDFATYSNKLYDAHQALATMSQIYTKWSWPSSWGLLLLLLSLVFGVGGLIPYILQPRHSKSTMTLRGEKESKTFNVPRGEEFRQLYTDTEEQIPCGDNDYYPFEI